MKLLLSNVVTIRRRYTRSVNLERDSSAADALAGYVLTDTAAEVAARILESIAQAGRVRAWSLTGVYGTGKSAFAHLLTAAFAPDGSREFIAAQDVMRSGASGKRLLQLLRKHKPPAGYVRAAVTGRREPISATVLRALAQGTAQHWQHARGRKPKVLDKLAAATKTVENGGEVSDSEVLTLVRGVAEASGSGLLLVIDELGKNLEHLSRNDRGHDLFLLQQLAELPNRGDTPPILVVTLLHQGFAEYAASLSRNDKIEWEKVQGRFEDVVFDGSDEQTIGLIAAAIKPRLPRTLKEELARRSTKWVQYLQRSSVDSYFTKHLTKTAVESVYPLHPLSTLILPRLCARYAQNDRSLFNFLAGQEPHALPNILESMWVNGSQVPYVLVDSIYDYFVGVASTGHVSGTHLQRLVEVSDCISEYADLDAETLRALKTIGVFNLVAASGPLRATKFNVVSALCSEPWDSSQRSKWTRIIESLVQNRVVTFRSQVDELRIWQGTDFDLDSEIEGKVRVDRRPLEELLSQYCPMPPCVAHRHSYQTGTLRYFEQRFVSANAVNQIRSRDASSDGVIAYVLPGDGKIDVVPKYTVDGAPLVLVSTDQSKRLESLVREYASIVEVEREAIALQTDGVARRELRARRSHVHNNLNKLLTSSVGVLESEAFILGEGRDPNLKSNLSSELSQLCDESYPDTPRLWNELLNRRDLTSQGARARRELINAMLTSSNSERLGILGEGPEYSMYASVLQSTGIHRQVDGGWRFEKPADPTFCGVWNAIVDFVLSATECTRTLDGLYSQLRQRPYGLKAGAIPVLLVAVLSHYGDEVSVYKDGTFIPILGTEHFELLVKHPHRFSVKHSVIDESRAEVLRALRSILQRSPSTRTLPNVTLLSVARPLVRLVTTLPAYSRRTKRVSESAQAVRRAILEATQPDELIFRQLPAACGLQPVRSTGLVQEETAQDFVHRLIDALTQLEGAYGALLEQCRGLIYETLGVRSDPARLRDDLGVRGTYLQGQIIEPRLRAFVNTATNQDSTDTEWLEALVMVVADKPAESWTDDDVVSFAMKLQELARRFANLEAIQKDRASEDVAKSGFEARRVTVTSQDGTEAHRLVFIETQYRDRLEAIASRILTDIPVLDTQEQYQAVAALLVDKLLRYGSAVSYHETEGRSSRMKNG